MFRRIACAAVTGLVVCWAGSASAQSTSTRPSQRLVSGDYRLDAAMRLASPTVEQEEQLKPLFEKAAKELKDAKAAYDDKTKPFGDKIKAMRDEAVKNGTTADLYKSEDYMALREQMAKLQTEEDKAARVRRESMIGDMVKALTASQKRRFLIPLWGDSPDPKKKLQYRAMTAIERWAPGVDMSEDKNDALVAKLVILIEQHDSDLASNKDTDPDHMRDWYNKFERQMRGVIEDTLTDEQKKQAVANRLDRITHLTDSVTDGTVKLFELADPTPEQQKKVAAITATAKEKMIRVGQDDMDAWQQEVTKFNNDVHSLLTVEQQAKRNQKMMGAVKSFGQTGP